MERRKLLQALTAIPAIVISGKNGEQVGVKYETKTDKRYVVFVNIRQVDIETFCRLPDPGMIPVLPPGTPVHAVYVSDGESMDDLIRLYEIEGGDPSPLT